MMTSGWGALRRIRYSAVLHMAMAVLLACLVASGAQAQERFSRIVVEGNQRIERSTILTYAAIAPNTDVTPAQLNDAFQRLQGSGLFEEVAVTPRGNRLVITVREFPTINQISIEGNKRLKDEDLEAVVQSESRRVYSPAQAESDAAAIADSYRQAGRYAAEVTPKIIRRSDNRVDLVFEVQEGKVVEIQRLSFVGNRHFSDRRLRAALQTKQAGLFRQLVRADSYAADRLEVDKQILRDFYLSRGYVDAQVLSATAEVIRDRSGFFVTFTVREGQQFDFGEISATSDLEEVDPAAFEDIIRIRSGRNYSPNIVDDAIARMEELATQQGLNFIRVEPRITRHDDTRTLDVAFELVRGPRIFVERIDIEGNTTTLDRVIRRQFEVVEGDPFNPRQIREAAERIRALGFFDNPEVTTREGSTPEQLIVDVNVEEKPTGTLSFGATYSAGSGLGGSVSLSENNFLGRGQAVKAQFGFGLSNQNYELSLREPAFLNRDLALGMRAYYETSTGYLEFFNTRRYGFVPSLSFPVSRYGRLETRIRLSSDTILGVDTVNSSPIVTGDAGTVSTMSIGATYTYDTRKTGFDPSSGVLLRFGADLAGPPGQSRYIKTEATVGGTKSILDEEVVLSVQLQGGVLVPLNGSSTRITDRFFMNEGQMRGFQRNGIGPRDTGATNQDALGGNAYAVARFEAKFPIGLPAEYGISGGVFYDIGSVWGLNNTTGTGGAGSVDDSLHLRTVVGVSIFWDSILGPLRFNFSKPVSVQSYDNTQVFDLTISTNF